MSVENSGELKYTSRAYRQDQRNAMKNDVTYGLIELVTNSDDEYKASKNPGPIEIFVSVSDIPGDFVAEVGVRDYAGGLSRTQMEDAFTELGRRNKNRASGTDDEFGTRGLFGRGAKDVATFGKAVFASHKNGVVSVLELDGSQPRWEFTESERPVTPDLLAKWGFTEEKNGLVASMLIRKNQETALPAPKRLAENLSRHVALRNIISNRPVFLSDERTRGKTRLQAPNSGMDELLSIDLQIKGYDEKAHLTLYRLSQPQPGNVDEYSEHGIVISDSRANYENSFPAIGARPETAWIHGRVVAPEIASLASAYDKYEEQIEKGEIGNTKSLPKNPTQIVKRDRTGLEKSHPYFRALAAAVSAQLKPILDSIAGENVSTASESKALSKRLTSLGRALGQLVQTALSEADLEDSLEGGRSQEDIELLVVPGVQKIAVGDTATFQIWVSEVLFDPNALKIELVDGFSVAEIVSTPRENSDPHPRLPVRVVNLRVKGIGYGSAEILVRHGENAETARIVCEPLSEFEPEVPLLLQWDRERYRLAPGRSRNLVLLAPAEYAGQKISIGVGDPLVDIEESTVDLKWTKAMSHLFAKVRVAAGTVEGSTFISANLEGETVEASVEVREVDESSGPEIKFRFDSTDPNPLTRSAIIPEENLLTVWIFANHSVLKPLLGKHVGEGFEGDDSPAFKSALSEIIATEIAGYVLQREQEIHPHRNRDAASLFAAQKKLVIRFLKTLQIGLLEE